ncbi:MAG: acyltransferase family protein, partial [Flavobacteriales bacterium]
MYKKFCFKQISLGTIIFWISSQLLLSYAADNWYKPEPSVNHDLIYFFPLSHLNEFLIGTLAGIFFLKYKERFITHKWNGVLVIASFCLLLLLLKFPLPIIYHNGFLAVAFVPLIIFISADKGRIAKVFTWKPLVFLGEISFGIYLLQ